MRARLRPFGQSAGAVSKNTTLLTSAVKDNFARIAGQTLEGTPGDPGHLMRDETAKWAEAVCAAGIDGE